MVCLCAPKKRQGSAGHYPGSRPLRQSSGSSISSTLAQGYTLADLRHLTAAYDAGRLDTNERRTFLTIKIARIAHQIASLEEMRSTFERELFQLRPAE
jgi:hypothetical protein